MRYFIFIFITAVSLNAQAKKVCVSDSSASFSLSCTWVEESELPKKEQAVSRKAIDGEVAIGMRPSHSGFYVKIGQASMDAMVMDLESYDLVRKALESVNLNKTLKCNVLGAPQGEVYTIFKVSSCQKTVN